MLNISNLSKSFGLRTLFSGLSLSVGERDRIAVLGPNGSGKTTLFEIIAGNITPDEGVITRQRGMTVGYLKQDVEPFSNKLLLEEITDSCEKTKALKARIDAIVPNWRALLMKPKNLPCLMNLGRSSTASNCSEETISSITQR